MYLDELLGETDAKKIKAKTKNAKGAAKGKVAVEKKKVAKKTTKKKKDDEKDEKNNEPLVKDYKDYCSDTRVKFIIECPTLSKMSDEEVEKVFWLTSSIKCTNMHLFDKDGKIRRYKTPEEVLKEFFHLRLEYYEKRKNFLVAQLTQDWKKLQNKVRFILAVIAEEFIVRNRKKKEIIDDLVKEGYDPFPEERKRKLKKEEKVEKVEDEEEEDDEKPKKIEKTGLEKDYDYLLGMKLWSLTVEYVEHLKKKLAEKRQELDIMIERTPQDLWEEDLDLIFLKINLH